MDWALHAGRPAEEQDGGSKPGEGVPCAALPALWRGFPPCRKQRAAPLPCGQPDRQGPLQQEFSCRSCAAKLSGVAQMSDTHRAFAFGIFQLKQLMLLLHAPPKEDWQRAAGFPAVPSTGSRCKREPCVHLSSNELLLAADR